MNCLSGEVMAPGCTNRGKKQASGVVCNDRGKAPSGKHMDIILTYAFVPGGPDTPQYDMMAVVSFSRI